MAETIRTYETKISNLQQQISHLQNQLTEARQLAVDKNHSPDDAHYNEMAVYLQNHFDQKLREAEVGNGISLNNEYELFPFCRFTLSRIYLVDPGLGKRVVEKPIGMKKKEIVEVVNFAVSKLNENHNGQMLYSPDDFLEGIYRTEPTMGTHYELYFRDKEQTPSSLHYRKVAYTRLFGPLHFVSNDYVYTAKSIINLILPLKGRLEKFATFMDRFVKVCVERDKRVHLTVVYFGQEGLQDVRNIMQNVQSMHRFPHLKLLSLNGNFSRGRGLQEGVQSLSTGSSSLLFFCDVDIVFSTDFLERCRLNAKEGQRVYYPIVFSLYNPRVVYSLQDMPMPSEAEQLAISKDTGFWRDFGYGMTCQYLTDFQIIGGFDEKFTGWGTEDVYLYKKYLKSNYFVIRATDPGIFHQWHEKYCDPNLSQDQYRGCIRSKALNEASHAQLGMLAFKEEIDIHKSLKTKKKVYKQPTLT